MKVALKSIPPEGRDLDEALSLTDLGIDVTEWEEDSPIRVSGEVTRSLEEVHACGTVEARLGVECSRCLRSFTHSVDTRFDVFFHPYNEPLGPDDPVPAGPSIGFEYHTGLEVDLTSTLRDSIVLSIPSRLLCREDCKGLCPRCGSDRNDAPCACETEDVPPLPQSEATANPFARFFQEHPVGQGSRKGASR